jgi:hypothetical protein
VWARWRRERQRAFSWKNLMQNAIQRVMRLGAVLRYLSGHMNHLCEEIACVSRIEKCVMIGHD